LQPAEKDRPSIQEDPTTSPILSQLDQSADTDVTVDHHPQKEMGGRENFRIISGVFLLLILVVLAAAWQWTPLKGWLDLDRIAGFAASVRENPFAPVIVVGGYVIGGLLSFPATILIVATAITFGPLTGFIYTLTGCVSSAVCCYGVGACSAEKRCSALPGSASIG